MALKFRVEPLAFKATNELVDLFAVGRTRVVNLLGIPVRFTNTKQKEYQRSHSRHTFRSFAVTFAAWVNGLDDREVETAIASNDPANDLFDYSRPGHYSHGGRKVRGLANDDISRTRLFEHLASGKLYDRETSTYTHNPTVPEDDERSTADNTFSRSDDNTGTAAPPGSSTATRSNTSRSAAETGGRTAQRTDASTFGASGVSEHSESADYHTERARAADQAARAMASDTGTNFGRSQTPDNTNHDSGRDSSTYSESGTPGHAANRNRMTTEQAQATANAIGDTLLSERVASRFAKFDFGRFQRPRGHIEAHVEVKRGSYRQVRRKIIEGADGGYVITGPTGCGKSTVALLPFFVDASAVVLLLEPTQANAANIHHEFTRILPLTCSRIPALQRLGPVPHVSFVAPSLMKSYKPGLYVTTTEKFMEYVEFYGKFPKVDYLIVDEFHLPVPSMVETVEFVRTFAMVPKYVFVSATATGFRVNAELPPDVKVMEVSLPVGTIPTKMEGSDLDPRRWRRVGDGTFAVVAPSEVLAKRLHRLYCDWGLLSFLITRHTVVTDYLKAASNYLPHAVFVLEPAVEAGITLSMAILASMGATTAIRFDGYCVLEDTQPLNSIAEIQRGSRAGRVIPSIYIKPIMGSDNAASSSADYYRAQAVIKTVAAGAVISGISDRGLFSTFPRLTTITRPLAIAAVQAGGDVFVALYKRNDNGDVYSECGGTGGGFERLASRELYLYHWSSGFYVAPISDFTDLASKPDSFVVRDKQLGAALAMVRSIQGLEQRYGFEQLIDMMVAKFSIYSADLFRELKRVFVGDSPTPFSLGENRGTPELHHFLAGSAGLIKLFEYMATEPRGVKYNREVLPSGRAKFWFVHGEVTLNFSFSDDLMKRSGTLDVQRLVQRVDTLLRDVLAVEILLDGAPDRCVNLESYRGSVSLEHIWFKSNVIGT